MDINEIRNMAIENQQNIAAFREWAEHTERRVNDLETGSKVLVQIQISMERLTASNERFAEKIAEMKTTLEKIEEDNKAQHAALSERIKKIEDAPGDKWNKAIWVIITAALMAASSGLTKLFAP